MPALKTPTVAELIAALSAYPPSAKVMLVDDDTGWAMQNIHVGLGGEDATATDGTPLPGDAVYLTGHADGP